MEGTPRIKKRSSLTLARHLKRDASPNFLRGKMRSSSVVNIDNNNEAGDGYNILRTPKAHSITSLSSDGGIECTPPHKKFNLDDSVEYSPKCYDTSFSPGSLLSQTLSSNSPEVGWKWGRRCIDEQVETATPDSAYAADSSFTSAGSNNREAISRMGRFRSNSTTNQSTYEMRKEEQRRKLEIQMRRAEKLRADELLKQRCAKLQEQLRGAEERRKQEMEKKLEIQEQFHKGEKTKISEETTTPESIAELQEINDIFGNANDTLDDFFNDSDSDDLLLEATQQLESKIVELTQKPEIQTTTTTRDANVSLQTNKKDPPRENVPKTNASTFPDREEKRSSLYMKFLEDDTPDDWLLSLDDEILQATQESKPRNSLQRHHSMPTTTLRTSVTGSAGSSKRTSTITSSALPTASSAAKSTAVSSPKIKRHSSSQVLRPSESTASSYRGRQLYNTK